MTLLAVEVSYCEASCALGGGEEMLSKQSTDINDNVVCSEFVNELVYLGWLSWILWELLFQREADFFFAKLLHFFLFLFRFIDWLIPMFCSSTFHFLVSPHFWWPLLFSIFTFFCLFSSSQTFNSSPDQGHYLLAWWLVQFWKLLFACKAHKDDGMLSVE